MCATCYWLFLCSKKNIRHVVTPARNRKRKDEIVNQENATGIMPGDFQRQGQCEAAFGANGRERKGRRKKRCMANFFSRIRWSNAEVRLLSQLTFK